MPRNPTWHRDELILALDLYMRHGMLDDRHAEVIELSEVLNYLGIHASQGNLETFRNPNGVAMKMANLAALDRHYSGAALMRGGRRDAEVWDEFANDRERLAREAAAIRTRTPSPTPAPAPESVRRYWAYLAKPTFYRIEEAVHMVQTDLWPSKGKDIRRGDRVIIWKGLGGEERRRRGIIALGEVMTDPMMLDDAANPLWTDEAEGGGEQLRVYIRYVVTPNLPLWFDDWAHPILDRLSVSRGQGTIFNVTPEQWEAVVEAAGGWSEEAPEVQDARDAVAIRAGRKQAGQGFRMNAEQRRAIEQHAMEMAKTHYAARRWTTIEDVSLRKSYDLRCGRLDGSELRVEVKGTTGTGETVLLTPNEVRHAHEHHPKVALFIVANIALSGENGELHASGGEVIVHEPWKLDDEDLKAIGYEYAVPSNLR